MAEIEDHELANQVIITRGTTTFFRFSIRAIIVCLWLAQSVLDHSSFNADGIAYLDMARSCAQGTWGALVNGYWSPGLPFFLSLGERLFKPDRANDSLLIHLLAFASLCVAMLSFEFFLRVFSEYHRTVVSSKGETAPDEATWLIGYGLFFWITTFWTRPVLEQPDILVLIVYLIESALCMQLLRRTEPWRYALLGLVLGVGYLVKAVMFPLAFAFLFALAAQGNRRQVLQRVLVSGLLFAAVSLPFCLSLSASKGRLTYGDAGILNYRHIMDMDDTTLPPVAMPRPAATPHIQEYSRKLHIGTYPPWADPSYDFKGWKLTFSLRKQLNRTHVVLRDYFNFYVEQLTPLLCGIAILAAMGRRKLLSRFLSCKVLWIPALAGLVFYATMRVEGRFLAGYTIALAAASIAAIQFERGDDVNRWMSTVATVVFVLLFLQAGMEAGHQILRSLNHSRPDLEVARTLQQMGIGEGERVSYMGDTLEDSSWAYLCGTRIVAEIPAEDSPGFWAAGRQEQEEVLNWLRSVNAKVLVTRDVPRPAIHMGWRKVGETAYYVLPLTKASSEP